MNNRIFIILILGLLVGGCKSKKKSVTTRPDPRKERVEVKTDPKPTDPVTEGKPKAPPANASYSEVVQFYIDTYSDIAMFEMQEYKIPASITLAQGILESGAGRGELTRKAKNHFGIKCHKSWTGERVYHDDDEKGECFRKYTDPKYSFRDHSLFLTERSRYRNLFSLRQSDYKGWARGLKKAGYATDPKYPNKLISIIERYDLTRFDKQVLKGNYEPAPEEEEMISYTVVKGDTLYSIARRFNLSVEQLKRYNKLKSNTISVGQVLSLEPK